MNKLSRAYCILQYSSPRPAGDFIQSSSSTFQRSLERSSASPTRGNVTFTVNDPQIKPVNLTGFIAYPVNLTGLLGLKPCTPAPTDATAHLEPPAPGILLLGVLDTLPTHWGHLYPGGWFTVA